MTRLPALALAAALAAAPLCAPAQEADVEDGFNLIEEGAKLLLKGLADEVKPMMEDLAIEMEPKLRKFAEEMAPMLEKFSELVDSFDKYHPPERLPNGDILLRRKTPAELAAPEEGDETEL
ncbi:hypothetical protein [Aliiruegeria sabulilitoris]|uniref:hypothetical protein n=1 Tax=Aliiruegeria sabulilitoris TaxID=1510458 RepID=UPI00082C4CED|nr:hypothetical protein [Aliiruegeria sabulilitoris]NDR56018.1 hypothetical protein [Pseudoruegeria sp. M32A2M]